MDNFIKYLIDTYDILITDINQLKLLEYNYEKTKIRIVESKEDNLIESFFEVMTDIIDKDEFKTLIDNTDRVRDYKFLEDKNNIIWNKANNLKTVDNGGGGNCFFYCISKILSDENDNSVEKMVNVRLLLSNYLKNLLDDKKYIKSW